RTSKPWAASAPATVRIYGETYGGTPRHAGSSTYPSRMIAQDALFISGVMADQGKEFFCPHEFPALDRIDVLVIEIKADQPDCFCTERIGGKDRPVSIGKTAEVVDVRKGGALRGGNNGAGQFFHPVPEERDIIPVGMHDNDRPGPVHIYEQIGRPVKVSENCIGPDFMREEDIGCCICGKDHAAPRDSAKIPFKAGCIPADHDIVPLYHSGECGEVITADESCKQGGCLFVIFAGKPEISEDFEVMRLPERKVHAVTC